MGVGLCRVRVDRGDRLLDRPADDPEDPAGPSGQAAHPLPEVPLRHRPLVGRRLRHLRPAPPVARPPRLRSPPAPRPIRCRDGAGAMKFCSVIACNYVPFARVLATSLTANHPSCRLAVLVIDDLDHRFDAASEPFDVLHLEDVLTDTRELHRLALLYDVTELATAVKPLLLRHLLDAGHDRVLYLDPDICVYAPLDHLGALAAEHSIVLTPHTTEPMRRDGLRPSESDILASGVFNLGFLAVGTGSDAFLDWWWQRLRRDCVIDHQRMLFTDQRWIDFVPGYFRHHVVTDPTCNVAYWNVDQRPLVWSGERYELDGRPLRFFHFSGFSPARPYLLSRHQGDAPRVLLSERPDVAALCSDYARR